MPWQGLLSVLGWQLQGIVFQYTEDVQVERMFPQP